MSVCGGPIGEHYWFTESFESIFNLLNFVINKQLGQAVIDIILK